jgi:UDP-galactopyranose mutase
LFKLYENLALQTSDVWFIGRLATYEYYNMDQIVGHALATFRRINEHLPKATANKEPNAAPVPEAIA